MVGGEFLVKKVTIKPGDVIELVLDEQRYIYARAFDDTVFAFYDFVSSESNMPPIGQRNYFFVIMFQSTDIEKGMIPIVASDPFTEKDPMVMPRFGGVNAIYGYAIYENEIFSEATKDECIGLEPPSIFRLEDVKRRVLKVLEDRDAS
jgi:hypothetical protein